MKEGHVKYYIAQLQKTSIRTAVRTRPYKQTFKAKLMRACRDDGAVYERLQADTAMFFVNSVGVAV